MKIGEVLKTTRSVVDPLNYSNNHHLTNQMPLVPTYKSHTALIKVGGVNRWLHPPKLGRSNVQTYPSYLNSRLVPRLHLLLVLAWDYSFPTLHPPPCPLFLLHHLSSFLPLSLTRGRTFDEIREESRRQQLQKNFPRVGRGEREEVYVEKGDWKQRERPQGRMLAPFSGLPTIQFLITWSMQKWRGKVWHSFLRVHTEIWWVMLLLVCCQVVLYFYCRVW